MMQWLPRQHSQRRLAIMLLALGLILVYQFGFSWYFEAIAGQSARIELMQSSQAHSAGLSNQRPVLEATLKAVHRQRQESDGFLVASESNVGIAELVAILKQTVVSTSGNLPCQLRGHSSNRIKTRERFEQVSIHAQLVCSMAAMTELFYLLERREPSLFVSQIRIDKQPVRRGVSIDQLKLQFDLSAYFRAPI
jgi:hypothetical protein